MKTRLFLASVIALGCAAFVVADPPTDPAPILVSIKAKNTDVKTVLADLFTQAHKNYVIQPETNFALHLSLDKVDFDEALMIVSKLADLKVDLQNGIYYISKAKATPTVDTSAKVNVKTPVPVPVPVTGKLPKSALLKKVTTKFAKTDMRVIFAEMSQQTGVHIEFERTVPQYKLDAILKNTSLRYALDEITQATGLAYRLTDTQSILIYKPTAGQSHVRLATGG